MFECLTIDTIKQAMTQLTSESPLESWMREMGYSVDSGGIVIIPKAWADAINEKGVSLPKFVRVSPRLQDRAILSRDQRRDIELICVDCVHPIPQPVVELMYSIYGEKWQYSDLVGQMRMIAEFSKAIKSIHSIAESAAVSISDPIPPLGAPGPIAP